MESIRNFVLYHRNAQRVFRFCKILGFASKLFSGCADLFDRPHPRCRKLNALHQTIGHPKTCPSSASCRTGRPNEVPMLVKTFLFVEQCFPKSTAPRVCVCMHFRGCAICAHFVQLLFWYVASIQRSVSDDADLPVSESNCKTVTIANKKIRK